LVNSERTDAAVLSKFEALAGAAQGRDDYILDRGFLQEKRATEDYRSKSIEDATVTHQSSKSIWKIVALMKTGLVSRLRFLKNSEGGHFLLAPNCAWQCTRFTLSDIVNCLSYSFLFRILRTPEVKDAAKCFCKTSTTTRDAIQRSIESWRFRYWWSISGDA